MLFVYYSIMNLKTLRRSLPRACKSLTNPASPAQISSTPPMPPERRTSKRIMERSMEMNNTLPGTAFPDCSPHNKAVPKHDLTTFSLAENVSLSTGITEKNIQMPSERRTSQRLMKKSVEKDNIVSSTTFPDVPPVCVSQTVPVSSRTTRKRAANDENGIELSASKKMKYDKNLCNRKLHALTDITNTESKKSAKIDSKASPTGFDDVKSKESKKKHAKGTPKKLKKKSKKQRDRVTLMKSKEKSVEVTPEKSKEKPRKLGEYSDIYDDNGQMMEYSDDGQMMEYSDDDRRENYQTQNVPAQNKSDMEEGELSESDPEVWETPKRTWEEKKRLRDEDRKRRHDDSLREIIVDGSNVAFAYTQGRYFSETGIKIVVDYFLEKGHKVKVFLPQYHQRREFAQLEKWYKEGIVIFTPSRKIGRTRITPYDDNFILEYATLCDGVIVSGDMYRDLYDTVREFRRTIEDNLLPPTFVGDMVMFPNDPLGKYGPSLRRFLRH